MSLTNLASRALLKGTSTEYAATKRSDQSFYILLFNLYVFPDWEFNYFVIKELKTDIISHQDKEPH